MPASAQPMEAWSDRHADPGAAGEVNSTGKFWTCKAKRGKTAFCPNHRKLTGMKTCSWGRHESDTAAQEPKTSRALETFLPPQQLVCLLFVKIF